MFKKINFKSELSITLIVCFVALIITIFIYTFSMNKLHYDHSPLSKEEISKINNQCIINELKNKFIINQKHNYPVFRFQLDEIKDYCEREEKKLSESNQEAIRIQKESLGI